MKKPVLQLAGLLCAVQLLTSCASQPQRLTNTGSGKPEVVIVTNDVAKIKSRIVNHLVDQGFSIDRDSDFTLQVSKPASSGENLIAALSIGNSYSTNRVAANYTFVRVESGVRVICALELQAQMPLGKVNTMPIGTDGATYNAVQTGLYDLKKKVEAESVAPPIAATPPGSAAP